jgi:acetolactate synthase-1/2/3 large subunit
MGYAIPAANALQLRHPDRPVIGLLGDGSLLMRATEIATAVEQGIAPLYIVWMEGSLTQIEMKQLGGGFRAVGARVPRLSCAALAAALGARGADVETADALQGALEDGLRSALPTLIGARVDPARHPDWYRLIRG